MLMVLKTDFFSHVNLERICCRSFLSKSDMCLPGVFGRFQRSTLGSV